MRHAMACLILGLLLTPSPVSAAQGEVEISASSQTVDVVPRRDATFVLWVNATIQCDIAYQEPFLSIVASPKQGPGWSLKQSYSIGGKNEPQHPGRYTFAASLNYTVQPGTQPEKDRNDTISWRVPATPPHPVPTHSRCSPEGYSWNLTRSDNITIHVIGAPRATDWADPDDPAYYERRAAREQGEESDVVVFHGDSKIPTLAAILLVGTLSLVALVGLNWSMRR